MQRLKDKWAFVTGASRGVGRQIANGLAAQGANLILHSRSDKTIEAAAQALLAQGATVLGFNYDTGERYLSIEGFLPAE